MKYKMSLREEIQKYITDKPPIHFLKLDSSKVIVDDILKLIEKRLDERAVNFVDVFDVNTDNIDMLEGRPINECPSEFAYLKALVDIKEMLKA